MLFLNREQPVVRESLSARRGQCQPRGQRGHSLSQHDPAPAAQVRPDISGLRTNTPVMMVGKMEGQAGAWRHRDLSPPRIQAQRETPGSSRVGRDVAGTALFCLCNTSTAQLWSRLERSSQLSPRTYREQKPVPGGGLLFLGTSLLLCKCLTGECVQSPPGEPGPGLCTSDQVTSETGQGTETSWFPGQHQQCEDTEIQLYSFSTFLKKSCSRHKDFQLLCKSSSLSQTFCAISAAVSEYPRVPVLSEIPIPALP